MESIINISSEKFLLLVITLLSPLLSYNQVFSSSKSNNALKNWGFEGQVGITSYFGDLSVYDNDIANKLTKESGPATGLLVTKYFGKYFGVSGGLIAGRVKAEQENSLFESNIVEYNAQVQFDLITIFFLKKYSNFGLLLIGGIGNVVFNSTLKTNSQNENRSTRVPEFLYFFGGKLAYHPSKVIKISVGGSIKQLQNDNLDITAKNSNYDYYSYINIGIAHKLNHKFRRRGGSKLNSIRKRKK